MLIDTPMESSLLEGWWRSRLWDHPSPEEAQEVREWLKETVDKRSDWKMQQEGYRGRSPHAYNIFLKNARDAFLFRVRWCS